MEAGKAEFELADDLGRLVISKEEVQDVHASGDDVSTITDTTGESYRVRGSEDEIWEKLRKAADTTNGIDLNIIL